MVVTADALKYEIETGQLLSKSGHYQSAINTRDVLIKLWNSGELNSIEKRIVKEVMIELQEAINSFYK